MRGECSFRHRTLRPIQEKAALPLLQGQSAILSAPTAAGKTEAVFAPLYQRHVSFCRPQTSVVYIAPTKALVNDMFERLSAYFGEGSIGSVTRHTGDHHDFDTPDGGFVLLSTPEGLDSLQLTRPLALAGVRAAICDELHLLHGTPRGQQLRAVLSRLRSHSKAPSDARDVFQTVGTTATVRNVEVVSRLWCGEHARVISGGETRDIELGLIVASWPQTARALAERLRISPADKLLVFANSRNRAHRLAAELDRDLKGQGWTVHLHIGILSRSERERVETAMKRQPKAICVATSTLEVGIDIGDIDVIVLADPPPSVAGFMQRVGRGNRRSDRCVVWAMVQDDRESRLLAALHHCAVRGELDDVHDYDRPSVDFQQILSAAWIGLRNDRPLTRASLKRVAGDVDPSVAEDMLATGVLKDVRGALIPSQEWCDRGDERRIHSVIVGAPGIPVVDLHSGEVIGEGGSGLKSGGVLFAGGGLRPVRGGDADGIYVGPAGRRGGELVRLPSARGRKRGLSRQVVHAMADLAGDDTSRWVVDGTRLTTWGGDSYNLLLSAVLIASGHDKSLTSDAVGLSGFDGRAGFTPAVALQLATSAFENHRIPDRIAEKFRDGTQFLNALSPALQREEARRAVPQSGFLSWLASAADREVSSTSRA